jgi:hypothetical protein
LAIGLPFLLLLLIVGFGHRRAVASFDWYQVVDAETLAALNWVRDNAEPGALVVASQAPHGGIHGWWIEGYAKRPAYNAADPRWFFFKEGKRNTAVANSLLSADLGPADVRAITDDHSVRFLFLDKRTFEGDLAVLIAAGYEPMFENDLILVLADGHGTVQ